MHYLNCLTIESMNNNKPGFCASTSGRVDGPCCGSWRCQRGQSSRRMSERIGIEDTYHTAASINKKVGKRSCYCVEMNQILLTNLIIFIEIGKGPIGIGYTHAMKFGFQVEKVPSGRAWDLFQTRRIVETVEIFDMDCSGNNSNHHNNN